MKLNIVALKKFDINCQIPPSPAESIDRPLNFVINVCFVCRICLGCFAWRTGWICRPLIEQTDALTMYSNNVFFLRLGSTSIGHARHVKTRNDNGLRIWIFSQKFPFSVGKKMFQRQIKEVQYTILIRHITNISDFVWFQRSCGSMNSVSSFSSIDIVHKTIPSEALHLG